MSCSSEGSRAFFHSFVILRLVRWHYSPMRTFTSFMDCFQSALFFISLSNFAFINICSYTIPPFFLYFFLLLYFFIYIYIYIYIYYYYYSLFRVFISSSHQALQLYRIESLYLLGHSTKTSVVRMAITKRCPVCFIILTFA